MSGCRDAQRVTLELELDIETIHGTLEFRDGTRQRFWGWLELMAALERVIASSPDARTTPKHGRDV
jgi:hypothetical protein